MSELHVFCCGEDGDEYFVAADDADCFALMCGAWGKETAEDDSERVQLPDDEPFTILVNAAGEITDDSEPDPEQLELTCAKWAQREGRGPLCSRVF